MGYITESISDTESKHAATKVCVTLGPASQEVDVLIQLLNAGATSFRIDGTWGSYDFYRYALTNLNKAVEETGKICSVIFETRGREVTIDRPYTLNDCGWPIIPGQISIEKDADVVLTTRKGVQASSEILPVTYENFHAMVQPGDIVYIGRYLVTGVETSALFLQVKQVDGQDIICKAKNATILEGLLTVVHQERSLHGIDNIQNSLPLMGDYDVEYLTKLSEEFKIDFVSFSYTRNANDIREGKRFIRSTPGLQHTKVIAKISSRKALFEFHRILEECDGVICSRGNLGLDCVPQKMAIIQKNMVSMCNMVGKPVFITRVVDSMVKVPRPTRAEATDVANAVLDGADGFILGAETVRGKFVVDSLKTVLGICRQAELVFDHETHFEHLALEAQAIEDEGSYSLRIGYESESPSQGGSDIDLTAQPRTMDRQLSMAISAMAHFGKHVNPRYDDQLSTIVDQSDETKQESIAASAVRTAANICASLIIVFTATGTTASLISKYRPSMPILSLVVPKVISSRVKWSLWGEHVARQGQIYRGVIPMIAHPHRSHVQAIETAIKQVGSLGIIQPNDHLVVVDRTQAHEYCVKILTVNSTMDGIVEAQTQDTRGFLRLGTESFSPWQLRTAMIQTLSEIPQDIDIDKLQAAYKHLVAYEE
eukprot:TRINITY_DN945_c0_g1_i5.p1 TRINITY_DN945_c0_g1~~TRINITY_DN945_c0_g1_i5.p1  ORF type:complete len:705 (-),score=73.19 TRINITY_DN945_c0_g1_i5:335-2299(-)